MLRDYCRVISSDRTLCFLMLQWKSNSTSIWEASKWPNDNSDRHNPDIYDCRTRPWYTAAANSPKNIVILQDVSGSMTGLRREIAKHVIYTILDTLTDNDYVSVLNFTDYTSPIVPCFKDNLVQVRVVLKLKCILNKLSFPQIYHEVTKWATYKFLLLTVPLYICSLFYSNLLRYIFSWK